jgi:hypothetical protein
MPKSRQALEEKRIKDQARVRAYIEREQLTAVMNTTKWCELVNVMLAMPDCAPRHRIKGLRGPEPPATAWDGEWFYHPRPYESIEWLEVECFPLPPTQRSECRKRIAHTLPAHSIPFSIENGVMRIWGYLRSGCTPRWEEYVQSR